MKIEQTRTLDAGTLYPPEAQTAESAEFRMLSVSLMAAGIGLAAGLIAFVLYKLIALLTNLSFYHTWSLVFRSPAAAVEHVGLWVIVIPVVGAVIIGLMARYGSDKIRGHGIPEAMEAVLINRSRIAPKVAILKPISAAIAIGTGGPFGAEGPIIQTGGAVGSIVGQLLHTTASERKVLLACGAAAGMAATFSTPIAGVILAIELLLFEFKARSFIPLVIASTLATAVHIQLLGGGPMFQVGRMDFGVPKGIPLFMLFGVVCGLAAVGFTRLFYWVEDQYEKLPIPDMWWPAIGAVFLGVIGYFVPRVLGVGYDTIGDILNGRLGLELLLIVMVAKAAVLILYLGSGTSGGLLAPMFMASAAMGGAFAIMLNHVAPGLHLSPGAYALVGMAAVFGAAARATFTFIIFAFEITRDYNSVLPLMLVTVIADGVSIMLLRNSIMTEKLARRGVRVPHEYEADIMTQVTVNEVMDREVTPIHALTPVGELARRIAEGDPLLTRYEGLPLVDGEEKLIGVITRGDILRALQLGDVDPQTAALDVGTEPAIVAYPDETVSDAVVRMVRHNIGRLPVVSREEPDKLVGWLGRAHAMRARLRRIEEEHVRDSGWLFLRRQRASGGR
ncbi:MAG TPA: chloride channel protein [Longimicrobiales bacterium]